MRTAAEQHWAASAICHSQGKHRPAAHTATHRVVPPGYGRLSGGVRIHSVDDGLPLPFLVDLPKASARLSVWGLSLKVLLIFIHIVHLERIEREGGRERKGGDCLYLHSSFPPTLRQKKTHTHTFIQKPHPPMQHLSFLHLLASRHSYCVKIEVRAWATQCTSTSKGSHKKKTDREKQWERVSGGGRGWLTVSDKYVKKNRRNRHFTYYPHWNYRLQDKSHVSIFNELKGWRRLKETASANTACSEVFFSLLLLKWPQCGAWWLWVMMERLIWVSFERLGCCLDPPLLPSHLLLSPPLHISQCSAFGITPLKSPCAVPTAAMTTAGELCVSKM